MKRICLSILFLLPFALLAQVSLIINVVGENKQPLPGATIVVKNGKPQSLYTASNGVAQLKWPQAGSISIKASFTGYQNLDTTVDAGAGRIVLQLLPLAEILEAVEVKSLRAGRYAPFAKTDLTESTIRKNNLGQDIPMLLNQTPSVVANSDAGNGIGYTGLRIRGTDATRINMTINGIPYNDAESQGIFFVNLPDLLSSASSIQVQRGVGTSSNGGGAFGASINISTHQYQPEAYAELNNSFGSFNSWKNTIKAGSGLIGKHFTIDARLSNISSDGYIDRASSKLQSGMFTAGWWGQKSNLKFNAILGKEKTYQAWYGVSEADLANNRTVNYAGTEKEGSPYDNETDNYKQNHYQLVFNHQFKPSLSFNTSFFLTTGKGYYEQYKAGEDPADYGLENLMDNNGQPVTETDLVRQLWLDNQFWGQVWSFNWKKNRDDISVGGGWSTYAGNHFGDIVWSSAVPDLEHRWYDLDARKSDVHVYTKWQHQLSNNKWRLFADLQYRYVHYTMNGFRNYPDIKHDLNWNFVNPKAGISYNSENWSGFFSYAVGNKEPNRDDFEVSSDAVPKREQLHDFEWNISKKNLLPNLHLGVTGYLMYYIDQLVLTGKVNDVGAYARTNIDNSYRAGTEWELKYQQHKWNIRYTATFSTNRIIDFTEYIDDYDNGGQVSIAHSNTPIAFSPSVLQQASVLFMPTKNWEIEWLAKHTGRQYLDNTGDVSRSLDAFVVNDLRMLYRLPNLRICKEAQVLMQLNNIFNVKYEPNGYTFSYIYGGATTTENYYYPMAGFNMMVALNIRF